MRRVPFTADEKSSLYVALDRHRDVVVWKLDGLSVPAVIPRLGEASRPFDDGLRVRGRGDRRVLVHLLRGVGAADRLSLPCSTRT